MLTLTRKVGQEVVIFTPEGEVKVKVLEIRTPNLIRLGFTAPKGVTVNREEIWLKIQESKQSS